jgi:hypothetical protein
MSIYYKPVFTTIRLEAVWTVRIAFARIATKVMKKLLKEVNTVVKQRYEPRRIDKSGKNFGGYWLDLAFLSIEEAIDKPDQPSYPDW